MTDNDVDIDRRSCHKAIMVITIRAHWYPLDIDKDKQVPQVSKVPARALHI